MEWHQQIAGQRPSEVVGHSSPMKPSQGADPDTQILIDSTRALQSFTIRRKCYIVSLATDIQRTKDTFRVHLSKEMDLLNDRSAAYVALSKFALNLVTQVDAEIADDATFKEFLSASPILFSPSFVRVIFHFYPLLLSLAFCFITAPENESDPLTGDDLDS